MVDYFYICYFIFYRLKKIWLGNVIHRKYLAENKAELERDFQERLKKEKIEWENKKKASKISDNNKNT